MRKGFGLFSEEKRSLQDDPTRDFQYLKEACRRDEERHRNVVKGQGKICLN